MDQDALTKIFWQGDAKADAFLSDWDICLTRLKHQPTEDTLLELFHKQLEKGKTGMLSSTLELYDLEPSGSNVRTYEWLRNRLQQFIRIRRDAENKRSLEESVGGGGARGGAPAAVNAASGAKGEGPILREP